MDALTFRSPLTSAALDTPHAIVDEHARRSEILVALIAAMVYAAALWNTVALDDAAILANPVLRDWSGLPHALTSAWWFADNRLYRPLTLLMLGAERLVGADAFWVFHAVSVVLYAVTAACVHRLFLRVLPARPALLGALLFAVAPVHAEAVASIAGQAELWSALFLVLLMLWVMASAPPTTGRWFAAMALSAAALATKEGGAAAPALAFLASRAVPHQRDNAWRWTAAASVGTVALLLARFAVLGTFGGDLANPVFREITSTARVDIALQMLPRMLRMLVLPVPPAIDDVPTQAVLRGGGSWAFMLGCICVAAACVAIARHVKRANALTLGIGITAATLAPTSNLLFASGVVLTGRTLYAASIGTALVFAALFQHFGAHRRPVMAIGVVLLASSAIQSVREAPVWRDSRSVLRTMVTRQPQDYRGYLLLGYMARDRGDNALAVTRFREAFARFSREPEMLTDAATVALRLRDTTTADRWLEEAIDASGHAARARMRLYGILVARGRRADAERLLREGLARDPDQRTWAALLAQTQSAAE